MGKQDGQYKLRGVVEVDEAYLGYKKQNSKRGRGTEKAKVLVAVSTDEKKKHPQFAKMKAVNRLTTEVVIDFVKSHFEENCLVQTDGLNIYNALKDNVTKHEIFPIVSGEAPLPWVHTIISNAKSFVLGTYHGIGPKHLQVYLDEFCYRFNRRFWENQLFNRMLAACMNCETITFGELTQ
jgi:transposase-like protein